MLDNELILRKELESVGSDQLRTMLHTETAKAIPDDDLVLTILHILEDREPDTLEPASPGEEAAWQLFRKRVKARKKRPLLNLRGLANAAVLLLVIGLLMAAIPQQAEADNWWDRIARWTDDFFAFFREEEEETVNLDDYEFRTDNPGLQQVYDAVVKLGVMEPVVPMWLPEGYELVNISVHTMLGKERLVASFENAEKTITFQASVLSTNESSQYTKDNTTVFQREICDTTYNIMRNNDVWIVVWTKNNIECSIFVDCQEEILYEILDSIYFKWRTTE